MKTAYLVLFSIFCIALSTTTSTLPSAADTASEPVLDITGKELRTGVDYYILPVIRGMGGGLTLLATPGNDTCRLDVIQEQSEVENGSPVRFTPVDPKKGVIRLSTDLNIEFNTGTICVTSTVWRLNGPEEATGQFFVMAGGVKGNPSVDTISNWFKIEKFGNYYKFVFCPSVCDFCRVICGDLGIFIKDGIRHLALSEVPFPVMFKKSTVQKITQEYWKD